jgi:predicted ATPase/DNA-binding CsgD family transcriptional regulator
MAASRIPAPVNALIGRRAEVEVVFAHLRDPAIRLVTLTGPGGVGKTRLALHVANLVRASGKRHVWYVELASVSDPALVVPTIAHALGIWDGAQAPVTDRLANLIGDNQALLVIDNVEQVVDAAPQFSEILTACANLTILITSRSVLHLSGEHAIALPPLSAADGVARSDAVALFAARAREARASFEITDDNLADVVAICERLDGLPLAIELAAARIGLLSPRALLPRLDGRLTSLGGLARDTPSRLRTMGDAIDWSYDLLSGPEQRLFRRLSVFVGGFSIEAAQAVGFDAANRDDDWTAIDRIASLVDQSLVTQMEGPESEPRFSMLETMREYGLRRLSDSDELDEMRRGHVSWCLAFAEGIRSTFAYRNDAGWRDSLEAELGNLRAALQWLSGRDDVEDLLKLATALFPLWYHLGRGREGARWLLGGLHRAGDVPPAVVLRATRVAAELIAQQCDHATANELAGQAIELARQVGDTRALAESLFLIGKNAQLSGEVAQGRARIEEALTLFEEVGHEPGVAHTRTYLAMLGTGEGAHELDDREHLAIARRCWEAELELFSREGNVTMITRAIHGLAYVAYLSGEYERALELSHDALRRRWAMGDVRVFPAEFEDIGDVCNATGQFEQAARLYGAASALRARVDTPIPWWFEAEYEQELDRSRRGLSPDRFTAAWKAGRALTIDQALEEALAVRIAPQAEAPVEDKPFDLTGREMEVLRLLTEGASNGEIATALYISPKTAANHVANILSKLGVDSRTAAASVALRHNIV